jgi:HPt (histidine-containing phosphotransfer) domain-containing protein
MEAFPAAEPAYTASVVIEKSARDMLCDLPGTVAGINLFDELTQRFSDEFAERFDALVACVISEDNDGAAQKSHALKGSCLTLGMQSLGVVLGKVEQCARVNDLASAVQLLGDIDHEWNRVLLALEPQK